jgi:hypothetical protein
MIKLLVIALTSLAFNAGGFAQAKLEQAQATVLIGFASEVASLTVSRGTPCGL